MTKENNPFWSAGGLTHVREIQRELKQRLQPLQDQLKAEKDPAGREHLKSQIKELKKEYAQKEKMSNYSLFSRR